MHKMIHLQNHMWRFRKTCLKSYFEELYQTDISIKNKNKNKPKYCKKSKEII